MNDLINRQDAIDALNHMCSEDENGITVSRANVNSMLKALPPAQSEVIQCKDCKYWRQQTSYQGAPLSFGFCESEDMWRSLYGETTEVAHIDTDDNNYCGFAERRTDSDGRD